MIYVDRSKVTIPAVLDGPQSAAAVELAENVQRVKQKLFDELKFGVYQDRSVHAALDALFHRKCGYCECRMMGQQPGDIEHYRPKGRILVDAESKPRKTRMPGYYWLAADWYNLLLSCADCNRPRRQEVVNQGERVIGKADLFPIGDERRRAKSAAQVAAEGELLLHPCVDDPRQHIQFHADGSVEAIFQNGKRSEKGLATIKCCGLDRVELLQARYMHALLLKPIITRIRDDLVAGEAPRQEELTTLAHAISPDGQFSALVRTMVDEQLGEIFRAVGIELNPLPPLFPATPK